MSISTLTPKAPAGAVRPASMALASARESRLRADAAEVQVLVDAVERAILHPPALARDAAADYLPASPGESPEKVELTAQGVPEVDRGAVAELGLALGTPTQAARSLIGDALELAYRLPTVWTRVVAGEVKVWRARRIAQAPRPLSRLAAAFVDRQVAPVADRVGTRTLDKFLGIAMAAHDHELADRLAAGRAEQRGVDVGFTETTLAGLTPLSGCPGPARRPRPGERTVTSRSRPDGRRDARLLTGTPRAGSGRTRPPLPHPQRPEQPQPQARGRGWCRRWWRGRY